MIKRSWIDEICFYNPFENSKVILTLKIMDFENVALKNVVHIYMCVIEGMNA
jgi:hypothetical protein